MATPRVFCDMDGVLADFVSAYDGFVGNSVKGWRDIDGRDWSKLRQDWPTFWMDLEYEDYAPELWRVLSKYTPSLLTAIPDGWPSAGTGKAIWARRMLPKFGYHPSQQVLAVRRSEKKHYARQQDGTPNVLIDDLEKNIHEWEAAGGLGIHYIPSSGSIRKVDSILKRHFSQEW